MKMFLCAAVIVLSSGIALGQQYKVLWSFGGPPNGGSNSVGDLVLDKSGNLYGTTETGGASAECISLNCGTVFMLSPNSDGTWSETVLYNFCSNPTQYQCLDGATPQAGLLIDPKGNLYGTTYYGGANTCPTTNGCGTIFELSPPTAPGGSWSETVIYNFCANYDNGSCLDGAYPASRLIFDTSGNLYGTTTSGGPGGTSFYCCYGGTVFELSRSGDSWVESVLYSFCSTRHGKGCPDGVAPQAGVTLDRSGNLFGTTPQGGTINTAGYGTIYKLTPSSNGWSETVLRSSTTARGDEPLGTVTVEANGNLFTTVSLGGQYGTGGVVSLNQNGGTHAFWFSGTDGNAPGYSPTSGVLIASGQGALYGTTEMGGAADAGVVYKLAAPGEESVLYSFCSEANCQDGLAPVAGLVADSSGNIYGTTKGGGSTNCPIGCGVLFEIVQSLPKEAVAQRPAGWHTILP
jgi:uncharacterized repeat protein (TIGR03803 family)